MIIICTSIAELEFEIPFPHANFEWVLFSCFIFSCLNFHTPLKKSFHACIVNILGKSPQGGNKGLSPLK